VIDHDSDSQELRLGGSNLNGTGGRIENALIDLLRLTLLHLHDFETEEPGTLTDNVAPPRVGISYQWRSIGILPSES